MRIHRLFALLIALALLLAPAVTRVGEASAAMPDHHAQMMAKGHCETAPDSDAGQSDEMNCCSQLCMGVAAVLTAASAPHEPLLGSTQPLIIQTFLVGTPAEIATPPPRAA